MMASGHAAVALGLASAICWGASGFSGGLASRRAPVFGVAVMGEVAGLVLIVTLALAAAEPPPSGASIQWGLAAGLAGAVGVTALYRALAVGQMGIAAPVTAVLSAGIPVVFGALGKGLPSTAQLAGFALAIGGVWFVSRPEGAVGRPKGLGVAIVAGCGFGALLVLIHHAGEAGVFWPLAAAKVSSFTTIATLALASRQRPAVGALPLAALAGVLGVAGNAFFLLAAHLGRLDVAAVVSSSFYPAATALLAMLLLGERMTRAQAAGAAAAVIAIPLIAS